MEIKLRTELARLILCSVLMPCLALAGQYQSLKIIVPAPDATVHDNNGKLTVMVESTPPISDDGDTLSLTLDGTEVEKGSGPAFALNDVARGSHSLQATIKSNDGTVRITSAPVSFQMWRASILFPPRAQ
jgi:hypothetical protein